MKQRLLNIKHKLTALWWLLTRRHFYLLSYNNREGRIMEIYNVDISEFTELVRKVHDIPTNHEIIMELKAICNLCRCMDVLTYNEIKSLIGKLKMYEP